MQGVTFGICFKGFASLTRLANHNSVNATSARKNVHLHWSPKENKLYWSKQFHGTIITFTVGHCNFGEDFY